MLWAHYGGKHKGLCLEFDTSSPLLAKLHKVRYTEEILELNVIDELLGDGSIIMQMLLTKASCWSYEREWRAIHMEADREYGYGREALTGVYFGSQLTDSEKDLIAHLLHGSPTRLYEVRRSETSLRLDVHALEYTPLNHSRA